jgi:hypothetical protein
MAHTQQGAAPGADAGAAPASGYADTERHWLDDIQGEEYVHRNGFTNADFSQAVMIQDSATHALDLASIITDSDATAVNIRVRISDGAAGSLLSIFCPQDAVNLVSGSMPGNRLSQYTQAVGIQVEATGRVELVDRTVYYVATAVFTEISVYILGWWRPAKRLFTTAPTPERAS